VRIVSVSRTRARRAIHQATRRKTAHPRTLRCLCSASSWLYEALATHTISLIHDVHNMKSHASKHDQAAAAVATFIGTLLQLLVVGGLLHDVQDRVGQLQPRHTSELQTTFVNHLSLPNQTQLWMDHRRAAAAAAVACLGAPT
jgi:hypothetical protein